MAWQEVDRSPLVGALNTNSFVANDVGDLYLRREPRENPHIFASLEHEYHALGFTSYGGRFRHRSVSEQTAFAHAAAMGGLRVFPPVCQDRDVTYSRYLEEAQTLDAYLPSASREDSAKIIVEVFDDLKKAHMQGLIYGDRWSHNMLVVPKLGFVNIDFDLEISGRPAVDFEVAQAAYYTLAAGKDKAIPMLTQVLKPEGWFDQRLVELFMRRHAAFFNKTPFGGVEEQVDMLTRMMRDDRGLI